MGKRFKFRLSRVIPTFHSCRSKDPSTLPDNPLPAFFKLSPVNPKVIDIDFPALPPSKSHHSSLKRHVSSAIVSIGCGCRSKSVRHNLTSDDTTESPPEFQWKKDVKWHVVARVKDETTPRRKIYNTSVSGDSESYLSPYPATEKTKTKTKKKIKQGNKKKKSKARVRLSTSSADRGWFSSDDEETETLVSSTRTFSTDSSSEFGTNLATIRESTINDSNRKKKNKNLKRVRKVKRCSSKSSKGGKITTTYPSLSESESPARLSVFQRLMPCKVEGKVKESFAIVKKSEDPYEDFKRSMLEMILEKQMFDARELEQLLHCFLSLNSRHHHRVIVEAFAEIWEVLFCKSPLNRLV